jgi:hypothetical protein
MSAGVWTGIDSLQQGHLPTQLEHLGASLVRACRIRVWAR